MTNAFNYTLLIVICIVPFSRSLCQGNLNQQRILSAVEQLNRGSINQNEIIYGVSIPIGSVKGSIYYSDTWNLSSVHLNDENIMDGYFIKYNIDANELYILTSTKQVKVLPNKIISEFLWKDSIDGTIHHFINSRKLTNSSLSGFNEVLHQGNWILLKQIKILRRAPTYNLALDIGDKETKLIKDATFYLCKDTDFKQIKKIRDVLRLVDADRRQKVMDYIKANKLKSEQEDFKYLLEYIEKLYAK